MAKVETFSVSKHFTCAEFLPPPQHKLVMALPSAERMPKFYTYIDKRIVDLAEKIRVHFGVPVIINNWHNGGTYTLRGYRSPNEKIGAKNSMHKRGLAIDLDIVGLSDDDVKKMIMDDQKLFYSYGLRRMESPLDAKTWCHLDLKEVENYTNKIYVFRA